MKPENNEKLAYLCRRFPAYMAYLLCCVNHPEVPDEIIFLLYPDHVREIAKKELYNNFEEIESIWTSICEEEDNINIPAFMEYMKNDKSMLSPEQNKKVDDLLSFLDK